MSDELDPRLAALRKAVGEAYNGAVAEGACPGQALGVLAWMLGELSAHALQRPDADGKSELLVHARIMARAFGAVRLATSEPAGNA